MEQPKLLVVDAVRAEIESKKAMLAVQELVLNAAGRMLAQKQAEFDALRESLERQERLSSEDDLG